MKKILVLLCIIGLINIFIYTCRNCRSGDFLINDINTDTMINTLLIDSIEYNIIRKDTIIYNIKTIQKNEIEKAKNISDSDAVKLFKRLVTE